MPELPIAARSPEGGEDGEGESVSPTKSVRFDAVDSNPPGSPCTPGTPAKVPRNLGAASPGQALLRRVQSGSLLTKKEAQNVKDVFRKPRKFLIVIIIGLLVARSVWLIRSENLLVDELMVAFDKGHDGQLSTMELESMLVANGVNITAQQLRDIFGLAVDDEGDGYDQEETSAILNMLSPLSKTSSRIREVASRHRSFYIDIVLTVFIGIFLLYIWVQSDTLEKKFVASSFRNAVHFTKMKSKCNKLDSRLLELTSERQQLENNIKNLQTKELDSETLAREKAILDAKLAKISEEQEAAKKELESEVHKWQGQAQQCMREADRAKSKVQAVMTCMKGLEAFSNTGAGNYVKDGAQVGFSSCRGFSMDKITFGTIENNELCMYETSTRDKIGEGRDCAYRCTDLSNGKEFALKMYAMNSRDQLAAIQNDLCAYKKKIGSHPNIVSYEKVIESEATIFVLMELIPGKDLFDIIASQRLSEDDARPLFKQLVEALHHLHCMGVIHSDIKPENAMVCGEVGKSARLKLIDFGCSCFNDHQEAEGRVVFDMYMPPEFYQNHGLHPTVSTDMWRLGCMLFVMLTQRPPYGQDHNSARGVQQRKAMNFYKDDIYNNLSANARDLIEHLIQGDPTKRLVTDQVLKHPWLTTEQ